ncbi:MAG TPA: hypothetical protein PKA64_15945 [Myxococcota bacterium]|nr:hypothetical protein [Myxococcota bacterium]
MPYVSFELRGGPTVARLVSGLLQQAGHIVEPTFTPAMLDHVAALHDRAEALAKARRKSGEATPFTSGQQELVDVTPLGGAPPRGAPAVRVDLAEVRQVYVPDLGIARALHAALGQIPGVRRVFPIARVTLPGDDPAVDDPATADPQAEDPLASCLTTPASTGYLDEGLGLDVRELWTQWEPEAGVLARGSGARIGIIEQDWPPKLPSNIAPPRNPITVGPSVDNWRLHATMDLAILAALGDPASTDPTLKETPEGIAPGTLVFRISLTKLLSSQIKAETYAGHVAGAISVLASRLTKADKDGGAGAVLLVEAQLEDDQKQLTPVTADPVVREVIRAATAAGVLVVVPSSNMRAPLAGSDVDDPSDDELGPLMVGGVWPSGLLQANTCGELVVADCRYGPRVDCFAWASAVKSLDPNGMATGHSGTSSASAIIASAACLLQSAYLAKTGAQLLPAALRAALRHRGLGRAAITWETGAPTTDHVGVMPDLPAIFAAITAPE